MYSKVEKNIKFGGENKFTKKKKKQNLLKGQNIQSLRE